MEAVVGEYVLCDFDIELLVYESDGETVGDVCAAQDVVQFFETFGGDAVGEYYVVGEDVGVDVASEFTRKELDDCSK